ncbi:hypothetical protein [Streptomyces sp. NPDC002889]|uniref:hypothetical protein n=1 Tax=Streptomyces sp. NPDC002889 TaxID=3364669 RepID=UPI0036A404FB
MDIDTTSQNPEPDLPRDPGAPAPLPQGEPVPRRLRAASQWLPNLVALLAAVCILPLIVTGRTDPIAAVAAFGGAVFLGGTAATVTVNIIRR